jgi:DNA-binding response OmpR family regulator
MVENRKILLVEDDESLGYLLSEYLKMKEFDIVWAKNGKAALEIIHKDFFDLIVLDVMMPEMDGFTLAKDLKKDFPEMPFIFLTSRSLKVDVLKGFSLGAVDYLKKPIDEEELVVRLNTLLETLNRSKNQDGAKNINEYVIGDYMFYAERHEVVYKDGSVQKLTLRENKLLELLLRKQGGLCSHKEILHGLWGQNDFFAKKSLNVFISHLRKYFKKDPSIKIENLHNQGFIFKTGRM